MSTIPWREVFANPDVTFGTTHGLTRAIEAGRIEAEFRPDAEIHARKKVPRYYDAAALPKLPIGWVSYEQVIKLLAQGSRFPKEEIGNQQMSNLLDKGLLDCRITKVHLSYDPDTEMTVADAEALIGRTTLFHCINTGEIRKRFVGRSNVVSRPDVEAVAEVAKEWMTRTEAAEYLGITPEAVRRWMERGNRPPTRPAPGLPKKLLVSRAAVEAKLAGRPIDETVDIGRLSIKQVSQQFHVPISVVQAAVHGGKLPAKKVGRDWMIDPDGIPAWLESLRPDLPEGDWLSVPEVSKLLGLEPNAVYEMCKARVLPSATKVKGVGGRGSGGRWLIERADVDAFLNGQRMPTAELMHPDFRPQRLVRTNAHPAWEMAKSNPNRWVKVDLREAAVRSEASTKNGRKVDLPGLWSVSKQGSNVFVSYQMKD